MDLDNVCKDVLEPVLLLAMGVLVRTIVMIMYLPIFQMAGNSQ
jgi:type II secretory pathway component PulF